MLCVSMTLSSSSDTTAIRRTFAELFCEHYEVQPSDYPKAMLRRCVYRRALPFLPLLKLICRRHLEADLDLICGVGLLKRPEDLRGELADFFMNHENRRFTRRALRLRISTRRVTREVRLLMPTEASLRVQPSDLPAAAGASAGADPEKPVKDRRAFS